MNTLQQLAWATHVNQYRWQRDPKRESMRELLGALELTYGEAITALLERGDKLPPAVWENYQ